MHAKLLVVYQFHSCIFWLTHVFPFVLNALVYKLLTFLYIPILSEAYESAAVVNDP